MVQPAYKNLRFEEDWSVLSRGPGSDLWDPLKFIPLGRTENTYLSVGGEVRARTEMWSDFGFGSESAPSKDAFSLLRLRLHTDWHLGSRTRLFLEGKSALATGRELPGRGRTADIDSLDLQNVIFDLRLSERDSGSLTLRIGRQEMLFGKQRLVSPANWTNTRPRVFDGVRGTWNSVSSTVDAFWTRRVEIKKYSFNRHDPDTDFFGIYLTSRLSQPEAKVDLYWLGLQRERVHPPHGNTEEHRHSFGSRFTGRLAVRSLDYDLEASYQVGSRSNRDIAAWMVASQLGNQLGGSLGARIYLGFNYASGDKSPTDNRINTFDPLFRTNHAFLGHVDVIGRLNIIDLSQGITVKSGPRVQFKVETHLFWRASKQDGLYTAGGSLIREPQASSTRWIGSEVDLVTTFRINRHASADLGLGHFFPGTFVEESGSAERTDFGYIMLRYTF